MEPPAGETSKRPTTGGNCALLGQLPPGNSLEGLSFPPGDSKTLFAATFGGGIFVSRDSGIQWTSMNNGLSDQEIYTLMSDEANPPNLYAGSRANGVFHMIYTAVNRRPVLASVGNKSILVG